jgi:hypothetical protein
MESILAHHGKQGFKANAANPAEHLLFHGYKLWFMPSNYPDADLTDTITVEQNPLGKMWVKFHGIRDGEELVKARYSPIDSAGGETEFWVKIDTLLRTFNLKSVVDTWHGNRYTPGPTIRELLGLLLQPQPVPA